MAISYSPNDVFMVQRNAENTAFLETVLRSTPNSVVVFDPNSILVTVATKSFSDAMVSQALRDFTASVAAAAFISEFAISASNANFSNFAFSASSANLASFAFSASHLNPGSNIYLSQSYIQSNVDASPPPFIPGILVWDNAHSTYAIDTDIPGLELQIGQEEFVRVVAGEFIPSGSVVYINGSVSSFLSGSDVYISSSVVYISGSISGSISDFISSSFSGSEIYISGSDVYISGSINDFISSSISSSFSSSFSGSEVYISGSISGSLIYISSFITSSISGSIVGFPQVYRAIADGTGLKSSAIGIASIDISASSQGFITSNGNVENLDTSLFNAGDEIYLSNSVLGGYQSTFPEDPYEKVSLGHVTFADPAFGKILVNISILPTLNSPYVGMTSVPSFVDNGNQTFTVGSATANFSTTSDGLGLIKSYTIPSRTISALVGNFSQYIFATFNNGNPIYILDTNFAIADQIQTFPVFSLMLPMSILIGGKMSWTSWGSPGIRLPSKQLIRTIDIFGIYRSNGLILSTNGPYITVTSGNAWNGVIDIYFPKENTSDTVNFPLSLYFHSASQWTVTTIDSGQYINNKYDDGTNLQTLPSGSFVNNYIYRVVGSGINNKSIIILSDKFDTFGSMDIAVPTSPPDFFRDFSVFVGRIEVQEGLPARHSNSIFDLMFPLNEIPFQTLSLSSSYSFNTTTASYALNISPSDTASYSLFARSANSSSYSNVSTNASFAATASFLPVNTYEIIASSAVSASWSPNQGATTLVTASNVPITSSWSISSSWSPGQGTTTLYTSSTYQITSSFAEVSNNSVTASYSLNSPATTLFTSSTYQITASNAISSSWAPFTDNPNAVSASYVPNLYPQVTQVNVDSASWVPASVNITTADTASYVLNAISTSYAPVEPVYSSSISILFDTRQPNLVVGNTYQITASGAVSASWAPFTDNPNAVSASWASQALSASYVPNLYPQVTQVNVDSASYVPNLYPQTYQVSSSWSPDQGATTLFTGSDYPITSSWSDNSTTALFALNSPATTLFTSSTYQITSSNSISASWAPFTDNPNAVSASWSPDQGATTIITGSTYQITASNTISSSWSPDQGATTLYTASMYQITSSNSVSASWAPFTDNPNAVSASYALFALNSPATTLFTGSTYEIIASSAISASWSPNQGATTLYTGSTYQIIASQAISASWAPTAGLLPGSTQPITSSWANQASTAISASWAPFTDNPNAVSSSYVPNLYPQTYQSSGSWASSSISASYAPSNHIVNADTASFVANLYPQTYQPGSSWASVSISASYAPSNYITNIDTASYILNAISSSYAPSNHIANADSASYVPNLYPQTYQSSGSWASASVSASYAPSNHITNADSASYILNLYPQQYQSSGSWASSSLSSSWSPDQGATTLYTGSVYQITSSNAISASWAPFTDNPNAVSASWVPNLYPQTYQSSGSWASASISSSYAPSNHIVSADTASFVQNAQSSSWAPNQGATTLITSSTYQITSSQAVSASWAPSNHITNSDTASYILNAVSSSYAPSNHIVSADSASFVLNAVSASYVSNLYPQTYQPSGSWASSSLSSSWSPNQGATTLFTGSTYQITASSAVSASWAPFTDNPNAVSSSYAGTAGSLNYTVAFATYATSASWASSSIS